MFLVGLAGCGKSKKEKLNAADKHFLQNGWSSNNPGDNTGVNFNGPVESSKNKSDTTQKDHPQ
jgi:hypothetical protein